MILWAVAFFKNSFFYSTKCSYSQIRLQPHDCNWFELIVSTWNSLIGIIYQFCLMENRTNAFIHKEFNFSRTYTDAYRVQSFVWFSIFAYICHFVCTGSNWLSIFLSRYLGVPVTLFVQFIFTRWMCMQRKPFCSIGKWFFGMYIGLYGERYYFFVCVSFPYIFPIGVNVCLRARACIVYIRIYLIFCMFENILWFHFNEALQNASSA